MANGFFKKGPKRNKQGVYEVRRGFDRSPNVRRSGGGGILGGIGRAIKGLVGATPQGDARRQERQMRRKIRRNVRNPQPTEAGMSTKGLSRGDARRLARTMAPQAIESQKQARLAENRRKRNFRDEKANNKPISLDTKSTQSQMPKSGDMPKPKGYRPSSPSDVNKGSNMQGRNMGGDMKTMQKEGRFDPKSKNYVGSYAQDIHGTKQKVGQFNKTIDINSKQGKKMARELYSKRFQGNISAKKAALKAGKESFEYTDPHTGKVTKMRTSKMKKTTKKNTNKPIQIIKNK